MADRNDATMKQMLTRAPCKKPVTVPQQPNFQVTFVFDQPFGSISDEIERNKFQYIGTSNRPDQTSDLIMSRRMQHRSICGERF